MEQGILHSVADLGDTVIEGAHTIELLCALAARCEELPGVRSAMVLLADSRGRLSSVGGSAGHRRLLELFRLMENEGPGVDCHKSGQPVDCDDLTTAVARWPEFVPAALDCGFAAVRSVPMWPHGRPIGIVNLLRASVGPLASDVQTVARVFSQVTTFNILNSRRRYWHEEPAGEHEATLNSPMLVGQATGLLAERHQISIGEALNRLLTYARRHDQPVSEVAALALSGAPDFF
ncbi:GAF and ANTAR domain-containing protein [Allokutzneria oryzae]|uniref:GAF and ANTAR domain-containing protein n=1 Tax=Allokutzneria oryzae TaxID=1378989 RepID=A0ABV5ZXS2_9PSEU